MQNELIEQQYFDALRRSGRKGCGVYQMLVFMTSTFGIIGGLVVLYSFSLFEMMPRFECFEQSMGWIECTKHEICEGQSTPQIPYRIDYISPFSLHNWVQ